MMTSREREQRGELNRDGAAMPAVDWEPKSRPRTHDHRDHNPELY
jgi:hypothetical protein